jgi:hypothetical protein
MSDRSADTAVRGRSLFGAGIAVCCLGAIGVVLCFTVPFPLIHLPNGVLTENPWDQRVLRATVLASLLASVLALFGRGVPRMLLVTLGMILALLAVLGYVQKHV